MRKKIVFSLILINIICFMALRFGLGFLISIQTKASPLPNLLESRLYQLTYTLAAVHLALTVLISVIFTKPLKILNAVKTRLHALSENNIDLASGLMFKNSKSSNEITTAFNSMLVRLNSVMKEIRNSSMKFNLFTKDINFSADKLSGNTRKQSENMIQIISELENYEKELLELSRKSGRMHTVSEKVDVFSQNLITGFHKTVSDIRNLRGSVTKNAGIVEQSHLIIDKTVTGTMTLANNMKEVAQQMELVKEATDSITGILKIIEDISEKTHVLATNASIEAAHAGEAGKGFAVVAGEVRNLSRHTAESVLRIEETVKKAGGRIDETFLLIRKGQSNAENLIENISDSKSALESIKGSFNEIGSRITGLEKVMGEQEEEARTMTEVSDEVTTLNKVISTAIESQMEGYMKISGVIGNAAEYSRNNSLASGQLAELGQELNTGGNQLETLMQQFILKENFNYENRRHEPREPLFYSIRFDTKNNEEAGVVQDISETGLKVQWNENKKKGDRVELTIKLPLIYHEWGEELKLNTIIMWQKREKGLIFAGLKISEMRVEDKEILQKMIYDMKRKLNKEESSDFSKDSLNNGAREEELEVLEELEELEEIQ